MRAVKVKNGIDYYTLTTVDIGSPEDNICCDYCPLLETYARKQCRKTGEYIMDTSTVGYHCPLKLKEENNG